MSAEADRVRTRTSADSSKEQQKLMEQMNQPEVVPIEISEIRAVSSAQERLAQFMAPGTKCRVISISTKYLTLELDEPTNLQQCQQVIVSKA